MIKDLFQQVKIPDLFKDELGGKIIIEVVAIGPNTYAYLTDDGIEHKELKNV